MSIEQSRTIDFISTHNQTNDVVLTIADHLDWVDIKQHLMLLQEKMNAYLRFCESGEILSAYPEASGRAILFSIRFRHPVHPEGERFLEQARAAIRQAGFDLVFDTSAMLGKSED